MFVFNTAILAFDVVTELKLAVGHVSNVMIDALTKHADTPQTFANIPFDVVIPSNCA